MTADTRSPTAWVDAWSMRRATSSARQPERLPRKIERGERGGAIAGGVIVRLHDPEGVGGTGVRQRHSPPVAQAHHEVVGGIARSGLDELGGRVFEVGGGQEAGVRQTGDVGRPRTDAVHAIAAGPQHRAAGDAEHPHIERPDGGGVAGDLDVRQRRTAAPDGSHVGRRAADLDDDTVVDAIRSEGAGHRGGGPGVQRAGRRPPEAGEIRRATVARASPSPRC